MALKLEFSPELKAILARKPPKNARLKILLIKERHLIRLKELSDKSLGEISQLEDPTEEQNEWMKRKMHGSARSSEVWNQK